MEALTYRRMNQALLALTLSLTGASLYFEWVQGLLPCPLCVMQRLSVMLILILAALGLMVSASWAKKVVSFSQLGFALAGSGFALRQLYLQSLPPGNTPACGPGLNALLEYFPWKDIAHALLFGTGECAEVSWTFLKLSMASWSFLSFLVLLVFILRSIHSLYSKL